MTTQDAHRSDDEEEFQFPHWIMNNDCEWWAPFVHA